jgi:hypothetical protein
MAVPPRLVASDLDGTLLAGDGTPSARTRDAVASAAAAGAVVVLATGRPAAAVLGQFDPIEGARYLVADNGAQIVDLGRGEVVYQLSFAYHLCHTVVRALRAALDGVRFVAYTDAGGGHEPGFEALVLHPPDTREIDDVLTLPGTRALRLNAFHPRRRASSFAAEVRALLPAPLELHRSGLDTLEIGVAGHDKATALAHLAGVHGIDASEALVFGDNVNDWTMFGWAGRAVAMANADQATRLRAQEIAPHHEDDGVARTLERVFAG